MASPLTAAINGKLRHAGAQIRTYRLRRRLTLARLGHAIGVTPSLLSMVERGVAMPSIGTLVAISEVLKVPMSSLFDSAGPPDAAVPVVRHAQQPVFATPQGVKRRLVIRDRLNDIELAENSYPTRTASADRPLYHPGREFGLVLSGRLRIQVGDVEYDLRAGDAIIFDSSKPHRFRNVGKEVARTLWVNVHGRRYT